MTTKITKEEAIELIKDHYDEEELEIIFAYHKDHPIELEEYYDDKNIFRQIPRWTQTIEYGTPLGNDPNQMIRKLFNKEITQEEHMDYNRQIGYSLYGYWEVFCFNDRFDSDQYKLDIREKGFNQLEE